MLELNMITAIHTATRMGMDKTILILTDIINRKESLLDTTMTIMDIVTTMNTPTVTTTNQSLLQKKWRRKRSLLPLKTLILTRRKRWEVTGRDTPMRG